MQVYLTGLLILGVVCAVVELLAPQGEGGGIGRHIGLMGALCFLCMLTVPLQSLMESGGSIPEYLQQAADRWQGMGTTEEDFEGRWEEESGKWDVEYAGMMIGTMLCERFSLEKGEVRVVPLLTDDAQTIAELHVGLSGRAVWVNTHEMEDYIAQTFGCRATIYIE